MAGKDQREESSSFPPPLGRREEGPEPVVLGLRLLYQLEHELTGQ